MSMLDRVILVLDAHPECWDIELDPALAAPNWFHITPALLRRLSAGTEDMKERAKEIAQKLYDHANNGLMLDWECTQSGSRDSMDLHELEPFNWIHNIADIWNRSLGWCMHCADPLMWAMEGCWKVTLEEYREMSAEDKAAYNGAKRQLFSVQRRHGRRYHTPSNSRGCCHVKCNYFFNSNELRGEDPTRTTERDQELAPPCTVPGGPAAHFVQAIPDIDAVLRIRRVPDLSRFETRGNKVAAIHRYLRAIGVTHAAICNRVRGSRGWASHADCAYCGRVRDLLGEV